MNSIFTTTFESLQETLVSLDGNPDVASILILQADENRPTTEQMNRLLTMCSKPIIGGVFPELIARGQRKSEGTLLIPMRFRMTTAVIDAREECEDFDLQLAKHFGTGIHPEANIFIFDDALAPRKNECIHALFNFLGTTVKYLGGGAGSLTYGRFPCVYHNSGTHQDAIVLGMYQAPLSLGVAHGWQPISEPMKITEASGRTIISINWEPAFSVYKKFVENHSGSLFTDHNFIDIAKSYPVGVVKLDSEMIIRDPFKSDNDTLQIVNEIREGEYISIMHGNRDSLLSGAATARAQADEQFPNDAESQDFCVDCITRVLFMGDAYDDELSLVQGNAELNGILSLGEIANSGDTYLEIYNKTVVVAKWKTTA